jgi:hypothetical protein
LPLRLIEGCAFSGSRAQVSAALPVMGLLLQQRGLAQRGEVVLSTQPHADALPVAGASRIGYGALQVEALPQLPTAATVGFQPLVGFGWAGNRLAALHDHWATLPRGVSGLNVEAHVAHLVHRASVADVLTRHRPRISNLGTDLAQLARGGTGGVTLANVAVGHMPSMAEGDIRPQGWVRAGRQDLGGDVVRGLHSLAAPQRAAVGPSATDVLQAHRGDALTHTMAETLALTGADG